MVIIDSCMLSLLLLMLLWVTDLLLQGRRSKPSLWTNASKLHCFNLLLSWWSSLLHYWCGNCCIVVYIDDMYILCVLSVRQSKKYQLQCISFHVAICHYLSMSSLGERSKKFSSTFCTFGKSHLSSAKHAKAPARTNSFDFSAMENMQFLTEKGTQHNNFICF